MRHGRKSRSKRFDGYKEHIARDLDLPVIVACPFKPANRPEDERAAPLANPACVVWNRDLAACGDLPTAGETRAPSSVRSA
ncbi:hypothetical protein [Sorangium sp. So ce1335]|uniref:hypothetical protein n=1 Tax=Sorangium sp. So ce1335 TaxID=3133335 RepID=UPI003F5EA971